MNKERILSEIRRTAVTNGGAPLGWRKFGTETGVRDADWFGKHWARWSDALREAGFSPNELTSAYDEVDLIERYIELARKLGRLPASADMRMEARAETGFPSDKTFARVWPKAELVKKVLAYCQTRADCADIVSFCVAYRPRDRASGLDSMRPGDEDGFVYLMKSGRFFKIGRTNAAGRREREIQLQLPEKAKTVHVLRTDDPVGIETYWHRRFESKRRNGEWFDLEANDVAAFKRRKFM